MKFKLLHGTFEIKVGGKRTVKQGAIFDYPQDLCAIFPNKFQLIPETGELVKEATPVPKPFPSKPAPVSAPVPVPAPAAKACPVVASVQSAVKAKVTLPVPPPPPPAPPAPTEKVTSKESGPFGADVTDKYPTAAKAGLKVFCKGTRYTVMDEETPGSAKNKVALNRRTLVAFLTKEIGA